MHQLGTTLGVALGRRSYEALSIRQMRSHHDCRSRLVDLDASTSCLLHGGRRHADGGDSAAATGSMTQNIILGLAIVGVAVAVWLAPPLSITTSLSPSRTAEVRGLMISLGGIPSKCSPSVKIVVVEFSDFQCPVCSRFPRTCSRNASLGVWTGAVSCALSAICDSRRSIHMQRRLPKPLSVPHVRQASGGRTRRSCPTAGAGGGNVLALMQPVVTDRAILVC
jgi:hypothetical protein